MKTTCFAIFFALTLITTVASAQTDTSFTYQGELQENGAPANGPFNLEFELWDAVAGGNQIGATVSQSGVPVVDGKFTVELDFGANAFDNTDRWLEITVNTTVLTPRQPVTRAPYAIQTRGIVVDADKNVGIGTSTPRGELEVANSNAGDAAEIGVAANDAGGGLAAYSSTFLLPHLADRVSLFSDAFESLGLDLRADGASSDIRFYTGGFAEANERVRITETGNVGIGTSNPDPDTKLHVESDETDGLTNSAIFGHHSSTINNSTAGVIGRADSPSGSGVFGVATATTGGTYGVYGQSNSQNGRGVYGYAPISAGVTYGVYGNSGSLSGFDFFAGGNGTDYGSSSSRRWKANIEPIGHPLEKISALRGVYFDWNQEHGGHHDVGMIAEEVGAVLPEIVNYEENGVDAIGMDYSKMTPLLVEAVKALSNQHDAALAENQSLRERLANLESIVQELTAHVTESQK